MHLVSAPNPMKRRELPVEPWVDIAIDLLGPLPNGDSIFVVVDYYSRYMEVKICQKLTSTVMIKHIKEIFSRVGYPVSLIADNGKQFVSEEFKQFCTERNITVYHITPYFPQQNSEVEQQNYSILKRLRISQAEKINWKDGLLDYLKMYNSTPHAVTGKTPAELFYKKQFCDKIPLAGDELQ